MPNQSDVIRTKILPVLRELIRTYQAFYVGASANANQFNLTLEQFDIIATLGNTQGMNLLQLNTKTLLTQNALVQILEELQAKELVVKDHQAQYPVDSFKLTAIGEKLFQVSFGIHTQYLKERFEQLEDEELEFLKQVLKHLRYSFEEG